jgi:16S rRNA (uracil1498-N3)-methyltransferase
VRQADIHLLTTPAALRQDSLEVAGDSYRHLFRARRLASGQRLRVVDGAGGARWAVVEEVGRASARVRLLEPSPSRDPELTLELAVAWIRPERAAWLVEKATELGVRAVRFFPAAFAQPFRAADLGRLERVAAAALEQCGGATLPAIVRQESFDDLVALVAARRCVVLDGDASRALPDLPDRAGRPWLLVVGPEGGLTPPEQERLRAAGARALSLGPRTLRAETAAVVGASLWLREAPPRPDDAASASR